MIAPYSDDLLIAGSTVAGVKLKKASLGEEFEMEDCSKPSFWVRPQIAREHINENLKIT